MPDVDDITILAPTLNEAIDRVIAEFYEAGSDDIRGRDGGSTDNTRGAGARIVRQSEGNKRQKVRDHVDRPYVLLADGDNDIGATEDCPVDGPVQRA